MQPRFNPKTRQGTITIDNFSGGYAKDFAKGGASAPCAVPGTYYTGFLSPNRPNYLGLASSAITNNPGGSIFVNGGLPINATSSIVNNNAYYITPIGNLSTFIMTTNTSSVPSVTDYSPPSGCTNDVYKDIWLHTTNATSIPSLPAGSEAIMYTYQTSTNAYLGIAPTSNIASFRNDTAYTLTNRNVVHVGVVSAGGKSFITDGNLLKAYDPNSPASLFSVNIGTGYNLVSVADYGNYCAAIANVGNKCKMVLWKGANQTAVDYEYEIRDFVATAVVNVGGELKVFCYGKNGTTKIKTFTGQGFGEEADWETPTSLCPSPAHNMCDVFLNQIAWKTSDGYLWSYGTPKKNELYQGAHKWGQVQTGTNGNGCVKNLNSNILYVGSVFNSNNYLMVLKADESYSSQLSSFIKTNLLTLPHKASVQGIQIYFANYSVPTVGVSGSSCSINLYSGYDTTTDLLQGSAVPTITTGDNSSTNLVYYSFEVGVPNIDTFYLQINFNFCTIKKIEIDYQFVDEVL